MRLVRQVHELGCGAACVAMVAGTTYWEALAAIHPRRRKGDWTCAHDHVVAAGLRRLGVRMQKRQIGPLASMGEVTLLVVDHPAYFGWTHYVVWDPASGQIFDPYPSPRRHMRRQLPTRSYEKTTVRAYRITVSKPRV